MNGGEVVNYDELIDEVLVDWLLKGGDFMRKFEDELVKLEVPAALHDDLKLGARAAHGHLQKANLERLRQMNPAQLRSELVAIFRW